MNLRWNLNILLFKVAVWLLERTGWYKGYWNHWRTMFHYAERRGLHIMPVHYYSPIPNTTELSDDQWGCVRFPISIDLNIDRAADLLDQLSRKYGSEYTSFPREASFDQHTYYLNNNAYSSGDAEVLYAMVRDLKPSRIIEVGCGYSTLIICQAIRANRREAPDYECDFTAIEPYPPPMLTPPPLEVTRVESKPLQQISLSLFSSLGTNDILFIDSTHVARIGSDVVHEFLTIVPNLGRGVFVHIHDIFIPAEYPRRWIEQTLFFWNEQYLVEAFLSHNPEFEVVMPTHCIWRKHGPRFREAIPSVDSAHYPPSSFWFRRKSA